MHGNYGSRKFLLATLSVLLISAFAAMGLFKQEAVVAIFPSMLSGLLGVLSLYFAGNITGKHLSNSQDTKIKVAKIKAATGKDE